jgi:hypothetical protein
VTPDCDLKMYLGRDAAGRAGEWWWRDRHELALPGSTLSTWVVENRDGSQLICRRLPGDTDGDTRQVEKLLDNEIRAMSRLAHRYGHAGYPAELPQLVGYNFDAVDPFVLCAPFRGHCAEQSVRDLLSDQRIAVAVGLLRALAQLAAVNLVHGCVGLATMWWDNRRVQLVNFERAAATGESRRLANHSRWASPDQVLGTGLAHPGDDVFSAGLAIYELFTGIVPVSRHEPDLEASGSLLRELLTGVFLPEAERRPSADELLRRLSAGVDLPTPLDVEAGLRAGRARFEQVRRTKYLPLSDAAPLGGTAPLGEATPVNGPRAPAAALRPSAGPAGQSMSQTALVVGFLIVVAVLLTLTVIVNVR